jgi:hypothetical protein
MTRSIPWAPSVLLVLLLVAPALACPRLFRGRTAIAETLPVPPPPPPTDPLAPPKDQVLLFSYRAEGEQIYECQAKKDKPDKYEWTLKAPDATLYDDRGEKAGTHGAGPTWEANDGSKVVAVKMASADAPGGRAVPWLLLGAKSNEGKGVFSKVTYIQRVDTWAGLPPATAATKETAGKQVRVKYGATYRFYGPAREPK